MSSPPPSPDGLEATIEEVVYLSDDGRFAVVRALAAEGEVTLVGDLGRVAEGETLRVHGRRTRHARFGERFRVESFTPVMPSTVDGTARYLGSGLVEGIGPALARRLVDHFGADTLDVIARAPERLREVDGIGRRRADSIATAVRARLAEAETMSFLHGLGLGPKLARKVLKTYGQDTARVIREDPYLVAEEVTGIGFRTADRIGLASGIAPDDPRRAAGAVLHLLARGADDGHVFRTRAELAESAAQLGVPEARVDEVLPHLQLRGLAIVEDEAVYAPPLHRAERRVAASVRRLAVPRKPPPGAPAALRAAADDELTATQLSTVQASLDSGLLVLTGGPGTGKTTTVRAVVRAHLALGHRLVLCAPTGRAAKRLAEATGHPATTIHRALEWTPATGGFRRGEHDPIDAELVLVDEASMLDVLLADALLAAVPTSSRLVWVGDVDQLPPVGPGQPLRDVITSGIAPTIRLTEVFRQAQRSAIVRGAHEILRGQVPQTTPAGTRGDGDLFVVRSRDPEAIVGKLVEIVRRLPAAYDLDPKRDLQVLSPMRRGPLGTARLNEILQRELNPSPTAAGEARPGAMRPGDKVMQLRNDYERDVYNGDLGEVAAVEGGSTFVDIDGRRVQYGIDDLDALALAYASTIHKVQGSEFPAIVIVLHAGHHVLLSRPLLYTAVTRARRLVVLLGDPRAMRRAAKNALSYAFNSRLAERLRPEP